MATAEAVKKAKRINDKKKKLKSKTKAGVPAKRRIEDPAERDKRVREVLGKKLGPDAVDAYEAIVADRTDLAQRGLLFYHRTGTLLLEMQEKYKDKGVALIAKSVELAASTVYACKAFAAGYDDEGVQKLIMIRNAAGMPLTWNHVRAFLVAKDDQRDEVLRHTVEDNLTSQEVRRLVQDQYEGKKTTGGRKPVVPASFTKTVTAFSKMTSKWRNYSKHVWINKVLNEAVRKTPSEKLSDPGVRGELVQVKASLEAMASEATSAAERAGDMIEYVDKATTEASEAAAAAAAEADTETKAAPKSAKTGVKKKGGKKLKSKKNVAPAESESPKVKPKRNLALPE